MSRVKKPLIPIACTWQRTVSAMARKFPKNERAGGRWRGRAGHPAKALEHELQNFDATRALGILAPVIAVLVWLSLRAIRRQLDGH